jgi:predicted TIM-barrel fold metal-dependent hydrolase
VRNDLVAIDIHTHPSTELMLAAVGKRRDAMAKYFKREKRAVSFEEMAQLYADRRMMAVILNTDDETTSGLAPAPNDHLAQAQRDFPDQFIAFCGIDPHKGRAAVDELRRCHDELGMRGIGELNPARQHFHADDPRFYPLWEEAQRLGMIVLFHTGMLGSGAGTPGGMGYKFKYANPVDIDSVAADFPELQIICAHPSWPWQSETLAMARHKTNLWIDLSGWAPKYFPAELVQQANSLISDRVLFGTDWPVIEIDQWLEGFAALPFKDEVRPKILLHNAVRLLGLELPPAAPGAEAAGVAGGTSAG